MKTVLTLAATAALTTAALTAEASATSFPMYADTNRDGIVTASEYEAYAFDRADEDDNRSIDPNERPRFDRLMDLDQKF